MTLGLISGFKGGWNLLKESFRILREKPILILPLLFSWIVISSIVLYVRWFFHFPNNLSLIILYLYLFVFIMAISISSGNIMMLELIEQIESGEDTSFGRAFKEAVGKDLIKAIPIALVWAIIWTFIVILEAITSKARENRSEPSMEGAAKTLGGANSGSFSWLGLGLSMLRKLVRMTVFLTLPSITWEDEGPISSFKKAVSIIKEHTYQFLSTYTLTLFAAIIMGLPLVVIFKLSEIYTFPPVLWSLVIIYEAVVWTLTIYFEQMSVGMLHLWHLKWVRNGRKGDIDSVRKPSLLDKFHELDAEKRHDQKSTSRYNQRL